MLTRRSFVVRFGAVCAGLAVALRLKPKSKPYTPTWTLDDLQYGADWMFQHFDNAIDEVLLSYEDRRHLIRLVDTESHKPGRYTPTVPFYQAKTAVWMDEIALVGRRDVAPGELWLGFTRSTPWPIAFVDAGHHLEWKDPVFRRPARRPPFLCCYVPATRTIARMKPRAAFHEI